MTEGRLPGRDSALSAREYRQVRYLALTSAAILSTVVTMRMTLPELAPRVNVRWAPGVSAGERATLERRFNLVLPAHTEGSTWTYDLGDPSPAMVTALVHHPAVEDTHGINRQAGIVETDAARGTTRVGSYPLGAWVEWEPVAWLGLGSGWATLLAFAWLVINRRSATHGMTPIHLRPHNLPIEVFSEVRRDEIEPVFLADHQNRRIVADRPEHRLPTGLRQKFLKKRIDGGQRN